jgi:hypothetical protein
MIACFHHPAFDQIRARLILEQTNDRGCIKDGVELVHASYPWRVPPKVAGTASYLSYAAPVFAWAFRQGNNPDAAPIVDPREPRLSCQCMPLANFGRDYGLAFG